MGFSLVAPHLPHAPPELQDLPREFSQPIQVYLQDNTAAADTARTILTTVYGKVEQFAANGDSADEIEGPLGILWSTFLHTSIQIPSDQPQHHRLVELLLAIKKQPSPTTPSSLHQRRHYFMTFQNYGASHFGKILPVFGMTVHSTESRNPAHADDTVEVGGKVIRANLGETPFTHDEWANLQKFLKLCKSMEVMDLDLEEDH